jgi:CRP-like cAMP-binding protein
MDTARLKQLPLFASLSEREREKIARWADEVDLPPGKHLVDEGQFAYEFFVIEEGTAEVLKGGDRLAELGPGDFFGEIALLEEERRTASVIATTGMRAIVMTRRDFGAMQSEMPSVAAQIRQALEERRG